LLATAAWLNVRVMEANSETIRQHLDAIGKLCETANSLGYEVFGFESEGGSIALGLGKPLAFKADGAAESG